MNEPNATLAEALAAIIKPIVKEAVREALNLNSRGAAQPGATEKSFFNDQAGGGNFGLGRFNGSAGDSPAAVASAACGPAGAG